MTTENELINEITSKFQSLRNARNLAISNDDELFEFLLFGSKLKDEFKKRFFKTKFEALIFLKDEFLSFLDLRLLSHSFTSFSNKIGLGFESKKFIKNQDLVVLNFPFKDCILQGGQSRDDEKNTELFFNNILARSEIDMLFSPKILTNFKLINGANLDKDEKNLEISSGDLNLLRTPPISA